MFYILKKINLLRFFKFTFHSSGYQESTIAKLLCELKLDSEPATTVSKDNLFVQWQNLDAMCWMDVVLIMLVYSPTLRPLVNLDNSNDLCQTLLITLLKANRQAQVSKVPRFRSCRYSSM